LNHAQMLGRVKSLFQRPPSALRGEQGERRAEEFLRQQEGMRIVARNWRNPRDQREELDLVGADGEILVFIEVKARAAGATVPGYYAVDQRKKAALRRAIRAYLRLLRVKPRTFRFDVVEVECQGPQESAVRHFANVPLFPKFYRP
jgi:putative endonuclease